MSTETKDGEQHKTGEPVLPELPARISRRDLEREGVVAKDITRAPCSVCNASAPSGDPRWLDGEPCRDEEKKLALDWFHGARVATSAASRLGLARMLTRISFGPVGPAPAVASKAPSRAVTGGEVKAMLSPSGGTPPAPAEGAPAPPPDLVQVRTAAPRAPAPNPPTPDVDLGRLLALVRETPGTTKDLAARAVEAWGTSGAGGLATAVGVGNLMLTLQSRGSVVFHKAANLWTEAPRSPPRPLPAAPVPTGPRQVSTTPGQSLRLPDAVLRNLKPCTVKLSTIAYSEADNVRGTELIRLALTHPDKGSDDGIQLHHELEDLLTSIPAAGLLEPPVCAREANGTLTLVAGYRRCAAVVALYGDADIVVCAGPMTAVERLAVNLAENAARKGVEVWRVVGRCYDLRETHKMSVANIAKVAGYSESHTENLIRVRRKLAPAIWAAWARWGSAVPLESILKLLPYPHDQQLVHWNKLMGAKTASPSSPGTDEPSDKGDEEEEEEDDKPPRPKQPAPMTVGETRVLLVTIRSTVPPSAWREGPSFLAGAEAAIRAVLGDADWKLPKMPTAPKAGRASAPKPGPKKTEPKKKVAPKKTTPAKKTTTKAKEKGAR